MGRDGRPVPTHLPPSGEPPADRPAPPPPGQADASGPSEPEVELEYMDEGEFSVTLTAAKPGRYKLALFCPGGHRRARMAGGGILLPFARSLSPEAAPTVRGHPVFLLWQRFCVGLGDGGSVCPEIQPCGWVSPGCS